ncbi:hypothetical protein NQ317_002752 [Molorchus minor]|uniref:DUF5641 domain-containing protein n=1 Tax=Molorchus minor TaxID=1323400 RepID=A0ABQ9J314_9CUCU|nr:hypothetical protein NQ317_002752 [Molorchus minor]
MIQQHFWDRWSKDYLAENSVGTSGQKEKNNIQIDDLVLLKDNNIPPLCWKLGRISAMFPGSDNKVRVVNVKTQSGELQRAISKL